MFRFVIVCAFIVAVLGASVKNQSRPRLDGRIVGGEPVDISEVPHQVSLQRFNSHICGGSIISPTHVFTAAHCTENAIASVLSVRAGSSYYSRGGVVVGVKRIIRHPLFDRNNIDYDYAILELKTPLKFSEKCNFVKLQKQGEEVPDGTLLTVSGWGSTQNPVESRDQLRAAKVPKFSDKACNDAYKNFGGISGRMMCAGVLEGGKDACQGKPNKNNTSNSDKRLFGGYNITIREAPYQVSIEFKSQYKCSGFIISRTYILSAAHCFDGIKSPHELRIRAGTTYIEKGGVLYGVKKYYNHPLFGTAENVFDYDFTILELTRNITYRNETIVKIELPKQNEKITDNILLKVTGWGLAEDGIQHTGLRAIDIPKINHKICFDKYKNTPYKGITPRMFCAGSLGKDACKGDSGGPAVYNDPKGRKVVFGVTCYGSTCGGPDYPGVYGKISAVRDWIKNITKV